MNLVRLLSLLIFFSVTLVKPALNGAEDTISGNNPAWATAANWSLGTIPGTSDNAVIAATGTVDIRGSSLGGFTEIQDLTFTSTAAVTLANNSTSANMVLALNGSRGPGVPLLATTGNFTYTIQGVNTAATPRTLGLQLSASGAIDVAGTGRLDILPVISENIPFLTLNKTGSGILGLGGANTMTGDVTVSEGTLEAFNTTALGTGAVVVNGGRLALRNLTITNAVSLNGGTLLTRTGDLSDYAGPVNIAADSSAILRSYTTPVNDQNLTISGSLAGAAALTINGNASNATSGKALILTNPNNTFSGAFNVSSGQALRSAVPNAGSALGTAVVNLNGGSLQLRGGDGSRYSNAVVLGATGSSIDVLSTGILDGVVSGAFPLTKAGVGTLVLAQTNTYSGATNIDAGTLALTGSISSSPRIEVKAGATFDVSSTPGGFVLGAAQTLSGAGAVTGTITVGNGGRVQPGDANGAGTLTIGALVLGNVASDSSTLHFTMNGAAPLIQVTSPNGLLVKSGPNQVTVQVSGTVPSTGQFPLVDYDGAIQGNGLSAFVLGILPTPRILANLVDNTANTSIDLNVTGVDFPIWTGASSSEWSNATLAAPKNWVLNSNNATTTDFLPRDAVIFNGTAANTMVNINVDDVQPSAVTFDSGTNYTVNGTKTITGEGMLTKAGAGTLSILNSNSFTGPVALTGGTVSVSALANSGVNSPLGAGSSLVFDGGTLELTGGGTASTDRGITLNAGGGTIRTGAALTLAGPISGVGGLIKTGPGTLLFVGAPKTHGDTTIVSGALQVGEGAAAPAPGVGIITNEAALIFNHSNALTIGNTIQGAGSLSKSGTGDLTLGGGTENTYTGTTTVTAGTLLAGKPAGLNAIAGDLFLEAGGTFRYAGNNVSNQIADTASVVLNGGTFGDPGNAAPTNPGATDSILNLTINSGTFGSGRTTTQTPFTIAGTVKINGGTALVQRGGAITANAVELSGGAINLDGGSTGAGQESRLDVGGGGIKLNGGTISFNTGPSARTATSVGSILFLGGDLTSTGANALVRPASGLVVTKAVVDLGGAQRRFHVDGSLEAGTIGAAIALVNGGLTKSGPGALTLPGINDYAGPTVIEQGALVLTGSAGSTPGFAVNTGATFDVAGVAGGFTLGPAQSLTGSGTISGMMTANGILAPGPVIAALQFTSGLTLAGTAQFQINKTGISLTSDVAAAAGVLAYGGLLEVTASGDSLSEGDSFNLFDAASFTGNFSNYNLPPLADGLFWSTDKLPIDGTLLVVVPEAQSMMLLALSGGVFLLRHRRRQRAPTGSGDIPVADRLATRISPLPVGH